MAIARLSGQDAKGTGTTSASATYPGGTTAGNLLICTFYTAVGTASATLPSGFSVAVSQDFSSGAQSVHILYKVAAGTETTVSGSGAASTQSRIHLYEYSGMSNPVLTDGSNGGTSGITNVTTIASGNVTTAFAVDLIIVALATGGSTSAHSFTGGFSTRQSDATAIRLVDADQIVAATSTYSSTPTWTTGVRAGIAIAAFQGVSTPAAGGAGFFQLM